MMSEALLEPPDVPKIGNTPADREKIGSLGGAGDRGKNSQTIGSAKSGPDRNPGKIARKIPKKMGF